MKVSRTHLRRSKLFCHMTFETIPSAMKTFAPPFEATAGALSDRSGEWSGELGNSAGRAEDDKSTAPARTDALVRASGAGALSS